MIAVCDYGVGNLSSICNMFRRLGADAQVCSSPEEILKADKILLPGVGHFDYGMQMLNASGLTDALNHFALQLKRPVLGICLGAQILGRGSEEGTTPGLGWLDMECRKLPAMPEIRVPHMGWNQIQSRQLSPLLNGLSEEARYYFVHSYYMHCEDSSNIVATARHGIEFTCVVQKENIFGTQFHPEKSLRHGFALLKNFVELGAA